MGNWCFGLSGRCFGSSEEDDIHPLQHTPPEPRSVAATPRSASPVPHPIDHQQQRVTRLQQERLQSEPPPPYFQDDAIENAPGPSAFMPNSGSRNGGSIQDQLVLAKRLGLLQHIATDTYMEGGKTDKECIICMIDFQEGDKIRMLPCLHTYHLKCIDDWLLRSFTCPACMEPVDSALLSSYQTGHAMDLSGISASPAATGAVRSTQDDGRRASDEKYELTVED